MNKKKHSALKEGCLSPQARKGVKTENGQNQHMLKVALFIISSQVILILNWLISLRLSNTILLPDVANCKQRVRGRERDRER